MNPQEILELVRAGYTKDEINAILQPASDPEPAADPDPRPASEPEPAADPEPQPAADPNDDRISRIEASIQNLITTLQNNNINSAGIKSVPKLTAEEALASLITKKE